MSRTRAEYLEEYRSRTHKRCGPNSKWGCGRLLPMDAFQVKAEKGDGRHYLCRQCVAEIHRAARLKDPDKFRRRCRDWKERNPERVREEKLQWEQANPDKVRAARRKYKGRRRRAEHEKALLTLNIQEDAYGQQDKGTVQGG